ncbi:MAG TPA: FecR domain-containing protein [Chloroflexi bacterium]|jgi:hypothetical protein|nr:FecR domain-containing protein [Chloroflexota bacterium]
MKKSPERVAWAVLLLAFAAFLLVVIGGPLGVRWYIATAEKEQKAVVESLVGTVVVEPPVGRSAVPLGRGESMAVSEGAVVRVDETSEATITLFDGSFVRLFPGTSVRLERMRAPRYPTGTRPRCVWINLFGGRASIGTAPALSSSLDFRVVSLQGSAQLEADGKYIVSATNDRCEVSAYRGRADVAADGQLVPVAARQRTAIELNQPPAPAVDVARNLVRNGDFQEGLDVAWRVFNEQGTDGGDVDGTAEIVEDEGHEAVRFLRTGGEGNHCETVLEQTIDAQLPDAVTSLTVHATVKVRHQSLSGGGYLSSEYPLMIRLTYRDVYDSETEWIQGFYYQNTAGNPTTYGEEIPRDTWHYFESGNLLEELPVRPYKIMRLRVYASGWDYESLISDVSLIEE